MKQYNDIWPSVRLEELVVDIQPGFAQRPNAENIGTPQLRTNNVSPQGRLDMSELTNVKVTPGELRKYGVQKGDVIFNNTNSVEWVGKTAYFDLDRQFVLSNHMTRLRVKDTLVDPEFLAKYLHYLWDIGMSKSRSKQWVNQAAIDQTMLAQFEIPLPPLSEQQRIVAILHQADELRRLRRETGEKFENLVPALFIEMFGDPLSNQKEWPISRLEDLLSAERKSITTGPFGSALKKSEYVEAGIPVWGIDNVQPNEFVEEGTYFITPSKHEELKNYSVSKGDILISRAGTVGRVCVAYPTPERSIISTNLVRVSLDASRIHPEYLSTLLTHFPDSIGNLRASGDEGSYSFLNPKSLRALQVPLPPIALQNKFFQKLTEIRKIKALQREDLLQINTLFQSLLAQAFTGDLTAKWREKQTEHTQSVEEEILESFHQFVRDYTEEHDLDLTPRPIALLQRPGTRPDLSEEQNALLYELASVQGYFTAETLKAKSELPLTTIRQGLQLFAEIGLIRVVRLPDRPMQDVVVYILSYRGLREEDQAKTLDLDTLLKEAAS